MKTCPLLLSLHRHLYTSPQKMLRILRNEPNLETVFRMPREVFQNRFSFDLDCSSLLQDKQLSDRALSWMSRHVASVIAFNSSDYPEQLKAIASPPPVIYCRGNLELLKHPSFAIAIVGSRKSTGYGEQVVKNIVQGAKRIDAIIVSGGALGIDAMAHRLAIKQKMRTVCILGCGLDVPYPRSHRDLFEMIVRENGLLLSDFPLGVEPRPYHFPVRNRLISALSSCIVVVEAGGKSGTLTTAKHALDQGKPVFSVPGSIFSRNSDGAHALLCEGAFLYRDFSDIGNYFSGSVFKNINSECYHSPYELEAFDPRDVEKLSIEQKKILAMIGLDPTPIDCIIGQTTALISEIYSDLNKLEAMGLIVELDNEMYTRRTS